MSSKVVSKWDFMYIVSEKIGFGVGKTRVVSRRQWYILGSEAFQLVKLRHIANITCS